MLFPRLPFGPVAYPTSATKNGGKIYSGKKINIQQFSITVYILYLISVV